MEQPPKTSFIPKQNANVVPQKAVSHRRNFNILSFFALILFLGSVILAVGAFLYKGYTENQLVQYKEQLTNSRSSFRQGDIESIRELDRRIKIAETLLDQHLSVSLVFDALEQQTQELVQFNGFSYTKNESGNANVELDGKAARFSTIALQGFRFADEATFEQIIFSDVNISEEDDIVTFKATVKLEEDTIEFFAPPSDSAADDPLGDEAVEDGGALSGSDAVSTSSEDIGL